jgi:UDP-N-acetyl-D-galactosamine dehydrogenase
MVVEQKNIAVVGLGYVGLPLAVEFGKIHATVGYDLSERKITSFRNGNDPSGDVSDDNFRAADNFHLRRILRAFPKQISLSWPSLPR